MNNPANQTKIIVRDFVVPALIGIYAHEQTKPQRIRVSIEVTLRDYTIAHDEIEDTISYESMVEAIRTLIDRHFNLVEAIAEHLATIALSDSRAASAMVRVEKLDVYGEGSVGTEIIRSRT